MLAVNVQETTTTTGTGNITLAGASEDGRTFTSQLITNERLSYYIDDRAGNWEHGIGYLSGASTLVRETLIDSSTGSLINFGAGTKQVFNGKSVGEIPLLPREIVGQNQLISAHLFNPDGAKSLPATRLSYWAFKIEDEISVDGIGVYIQTSAGTGANKLHLAVYQTTGSMYPGDKIASGDDLDPSVTGFQSVAFTALTLKPAWYFIGAWSDVAPSIRGYSATDALPCGLGYAAGMVPQQGFRSVTTGLLTMPDPATAGMTQPTTNDNWSVYLEKV